MPVMNGLEATKAIRERERRQRRRRSVIVAVTAAASAEDKANCIRAGMDDYTTKPIYPAHIRGLIESCIQNLER